VRQRSFLDVVRTFASANDVSGRYRNERAALASADPLATDETRRSGDSCRGGDVEGAGSTEHAARASHRAARNVLHVAG